MKRLSSEGCLLTVIKSRVNTHSGKENDNATSMLGVLRSAFVPTLLEVAEEEVRLKRDPKNSEIYRQAGRM